MKIAKNCAVALSYALEVEGKIADKADASAPLEYIHGMHMLLPRFEEEVEGKEVGETFEFTLTPEEGYGTRNPQYVFDLPKASFSIDGQVREDLLVVGNVIPMLNTSGQVVQGTIVEIKDDCVAMDFNHPMAGKTLHFTGSVVSVREATEKELKEGLHGEFLPQEECGCGCGHHHGGDCHCHEDGCGCHEDGCGCHEDGCDCKGGDCK